jgi:hypothetical protein
MAGLTCHALGYIFNRIFTELKSRNVKYFGVVWTQTFGTFSHPLNIAWMSLTCDDSEERALAMAMYVQKFNSSAVAILILNRVIMGANIAGIYGAQIFRADDKPKYRRGFSINIGVLTFALVLAFFRFIDDRFRRKRVAIQDQIESSSDHNSSQDHDEKAAQPSDVQPAPVYFDGDSKRAVSGADTSRNI